MICWLKRNNYNSGVIPSLRQYFFSLQSLWKPVQISFAILSSLASICICCHFIWCLGVWSPPHASLLESWASGCAGWLESGVHSTPLLPASLTLWTSIHFLEIPSCARCRRSIVLRDACIFNSQSSFCLRTMWLNVAAYNICTKLPGVSGGGLACALGLCWLSLGWSYCTFPLRCRNNLTVIDMVAVEGFGAQELLKVGGRLPGAGGSLRFKVPESTLMDCRRREFTGSTPATSLSFI